MRDWAKPATTLFLALGLGGACFCVDLTHLAVNHTYDGMVFASLIEQRHPSAWDLFHPHHLIYNWLGRQFFLFGHTHGADWDGLGALQCFDLLTGTAGVLLVFHLLVRVTGDRGTAFLSALGLSFTYSYWYFSTSPGVRIFATVTPLLAWYAFTYVKDRGVGWGAVLGLAHAFAVLGHQTNLLLLPAFLGGIWCVREKTFREKIGISLLYLAVLTAAVLGAYGFVGRFLCERTTYSAWVWWIMSYMHVKEWGGHLGPAGFERGKFAMVFAFLAGAYPTKPLGDYLTFGFAKGIFQNALLFVLGALLLRARAFWARYPQTLWIGFFWLMAFVPFFVWWEPWNIEFWVSSTVPCWILMGTVVSDLSLKFTNPVLRFANRLLFLFLWGCLIGLLFLYNFEGRGVHATPYANKTLMSA
ncbi:MAG TPA: glycosyltransferase family 39 protein, partial [bacterium]|nr:glycosyltransferase family 39 protein [bacterium]